MTTQTKDINMISGGVRSYVNVSQYDVGSEIKFALYNNSSAFTPPAGTTVRVEGRKPDGNGFSYSASLSDNVVTVTVTDQMTVLSGEVLCELRLTKDSVDIGTANFILAVEEAPINSDIPISDTEIPAIIELARQEQYTAEAWAQGTRNGVPVSSDDPTYHNNAKYYGGQPAADISYYKQNGYLAKNLCYKITYGYPNNGADNVGTVRNDWFVSNMTNTAARSCYAKVIPGRTYTIKSSKGNRMMVSAYTNADYTTPQTGIKLTNDNASNPRTFTVPEGYNYVCVYLGINFTADETPTVMIEEGSTASDYMQYAPSNIELANSKADITSIGTDESGRTTASRQYAYGERFYKDGKFCRIKTTDGVAQGATWTLGTNYTEGDIASSLEEYVKSNSSGVASVQTKTNEWMIVFANGGLYTLLVTTAFQYHALNKIYEASGISASYDTSTGILSISGVGGNRNVFVKRIPLSF